MDREHFAELLKSKGLKVTNQRIGVLEALSDSQDRHLTAEEIYGLVQDKYPDIGLATVYRTIQLLLELNLIDRINLDDGCARYEIEHKTAESQHHHHHLICLSCGELYSFEDDFLEALEKHIQESTGFQVTDHEVKLYGYCEECQKKQNSE